MTGHDDECRALTRYLTGRPPDAYVASCYRRARGYEPGARDRPAPIDRVLWRAALASRATARLADGYARWFRPAGPLRRRLTLLLAILESAPSTHTWLNTAETGSRLGVSLRLAWGLALSTGALALGVATFGPIHLATAWVRPAAAPPA